MDQNLDEISDKALRSRRRLALRGYILITGVYHLNEMRFVCGPTFESIGTRSCSDLSYDLESYLEKSVRVWMAKENQNGSLDKYLAARLENYLQQNDRLKTWVKSKIYLVNE